MKRTFIAVKIDPDKKLEEAVRQIRLKLKNESVRWTDLSQLHVTLAFLGNTSEQSIVGVTAMLTAVCYDFGEFEFTVKGIGVFRSVADPRVIWAGIDDSKKLGELADRIKNGLKELGIVTGDRQFKPHLTLARVRSVSNQNSFRTITDEYERIEFQKSHISEVIYFESILRETGPLYLPIKKVRL
jgi:2'-5' RNA ligase